MSFPQGLISLMLRKGGAVGNDGASPPQGSGLLGWARSLHSSLGLQADAMATSDDAVASLLAMAKRTNWHLSHLHHLSQPESNFVTLYASPTNTVTPATPRAPWEWMHVRKIVIPGSMGQIWVPRMFSGSSDLGSNYVLRLCEETTLASWAAPSTFTQGEFSLDANKEWWTDLQAETNAQLSALTTVFTFSYTNEKGISGRTAMFTIPGSGTVGHYRTVNIQLQSPDLGVLSIQSMEANHANNTTGGLNLVGHKTAAASVVLKAGNGITAIPPVNIADLAFKPGRILGFEYAAESTSQANVFAFVSGNLQEEHAL